MGIVQQGEDQNLTLYENNGYGWHMGQFQEGSLSAFHFVKPIQTQWHHWLQLLQHTIASFFPLHLQCSAGQISFDSLGVALVTLVFFFGFTT